MMRNAKAMTTNRGHAGENLPVKSDLLLYRTEDGRTRIEVLLQDETVWMTQATMGELYQTSPQNITLHLKSLYEVAELGRMATCKEYLQVQHEGEREVRRALKFYNLSAILAVGYRVRSPRGVQFRRWATEKLNEYLLKGFVMNDERVKQGRNIGSDYFDELLERIRDIRASEKRFYQKIRDIYRLAIDYDPKADVTREFFKAMQNKLHFAICGKTAAEIIAERADVSKPNMGLTTCRARPYVCPINRWAETSPAPTQPQSDSLNNLWSHGLAKLSRATKTRPHPAERTPNDPQ